MAQTPERVPPIDEWGVLLADRVAVVTGGGAGIGAAIARLFARHGALVEIADVDDERGRAVAASIGEAGGRARAHAVDVRDDGMVSDLRAAVLHEHGGVHVLVNNVGDYRPTAPFHASGPELWQAQYDNNLRHLFTVTHAFLGAMIDGGGGSIVNVHSVEGMRGFPADPVYAAMKAAVVQFTRSLAAGYGRKGIRCNGIGPDVTQTPQVDYQADARAGDDERWRSWVPVGRLGWPEDTARVALFLASDLSAFVTGHSIPVDGGTLSQSGWFHSPTERRFVNRPRQL